MSNPPWRNDKWHTSFWNFTDDARKMLNFKPSFEFHDVTMRDGEQQAGVVFSPTQKIAIAEKLAEIGVHRIEPGMPAVTKDDENAIREIAKRNLGPKIFTFARCMNDDIDLTVDCGCTGVCMEIPANKEMLNKAYGWEAQRAIDTAISATKYAKEKGLYVALFLLDFSRSEVAFSHEFIDSVYKDGYFDSVCCVDTSGVFNPFGAYYATKSLVDRYPDKKVEFHGHDDFGTGSMNSVMALAAGADCVHTSISSIGDRSGNVSYEEIDAQLLMQYGIDSGLKHELLFPMSQFTLGLINRPARANKGIIGKDISRNESGLSVGWMENLKKTNDELVLLPFFPWVFGHPKNSYVIGKHSGAPTIGFFLKELGYGEQERNVVDKVLQDVKDFSCMKGTELTIDEFKRIVDKYL